MFTKKFENSFEQGKITQDKIRVHNIKLGSKLVVQQNQVAFIVVKGNVLDKFPEGSFELTGSYIPKVFKFCKLDKARKKRISKKKYYLNHFNGSIMFINLQEFKDLTFETKNILLFDRLDDFKFKISGKFNFKIIDIDLFAKFIAKYGKSNDYIVKNVIKFVSKKIRYEFHKEEFEIEHFLMKESTIFDKIMTKLSKRLMKIGIEVYDPILTGFNVNKHNQRKINELISQGQITIRYQKINQGDENYVDFG